MRMYRATGTAGGRRRVLRFSNLDLAAEHALDALESTVKPDGSFEGNLEAGLLFNATHIVVRRFRKTPLSASEESNELALADYILANQHHNGLFLAYPGGPVSREATHVALIALQRVSASNRILSDHRRGATRVSLQTAIDRGHRALRQAHTRSEELIFQKGFRHLLEVLDDNRHGVAHHLPDVRALAISTVGTAALLRSPAWQWFEASCYPFITSIFPMLALMAEGVLARTTTGRALRTLRDRLPLSLLDKNRKQAMKALVEHLLEHQDGTGAFFYSSQYTQLFIAALEGALEAGVAPELGVRIQAAIARAERYIEANQPELESGRCVRFLGSDIWDTAGVGLAALEGHRPAFDEGTLMRMASFLLQHQNDDGGWPFGRQSRFTDTDSTAWSLGFLTMLRRRGLCAPLHKRIDEALARTLEMLETYASSSGGFGVWGRSPLPKPPGTVGELGSVLLDLPTEDVTARVLLALGPARRLWHESSGFKASLGHDRFERLVRVADGAFEFLRARRHPEHGLWPSRWTLSFLPGTAFVLSGLRHHPYPEVERFRRDAAKTILSCQNQDGGFGESMQTDRENAFLPGAVSTTLHTVSALNILRDAGLRRTHPAYERALDFVVGNQREDGSFPEHSVYTCFTGFYYRYPLMTQAAAVGFLLRERDDA